MPKYFSNSRLFFILKIAVYIFLVAAIFISLFIEGYVLEDLNFGPKVILIAFLIGFFMLDKKEKVPFDIELRFYDDYIDLYREKCYYNRLVTRKEHNKIFYKNFQRCEYRTNTKRLNFYGDKEGIWYNYKKDGTLPAEPTYHRTITEALAYFYVCGDEYQELIAEIEAHSPIKVTYKDI